MEKAEFSIQFKVADESHVEQMFHIEEAVFPVPWSYDSLYQDVCEHEISVYVVGMCGDEVVAYGGFWHVHDESHITNIAVKSGYRKMGIGSAMMKLLFDTARKLKVETMTLEVRESNSAAIGMYEKMGFQTVNRRKKYYNNEDALIMNINLSDRSVDPL